MSIKTIFSILDAAAGCYSNPFLAPHVGVAVRDFGQAVNTPNENSSLYNHPADFAMYELGSFDDASGEIIPLERPKLITQAASLKKE